MILATAYLDTNFFSVLHYSGGSTVVRIQQMKTREWWELERHNFRLYSSVFTENELSVGSYPGQKDAIAACKRLPYLAEVALVRRMKTLIVENTIVPLAKRGDAVQLALASVYNVDYLLTWNYSHLANDQVQRRLSVLNEEHGLRSPLVVSPETIPWLNRGQAVRRKANEK